MSTDKSFALRTKLWKGARILFPTCLCAALLLDLPVSRVGGLLEILLVTAVVCLYRLDVLNIWTVFAVPWIVILVFSGMNLSEASRDISLATLAVVGAGLFAAMAMFGPSSARQRSPYRCRRLRPNRQAFVGLVIVFLAFSLLNVALAGYVPLIQAVVTGDSGYMDFGVRGIYGLYNAYANALGVTACYFWIRTGERLYKLTFVAVLMAFLLFVTRQNLVSLLIESFVVYNLTARRTSTWTLLGALMAMLLGFAAIGNLRTGNNIADTAQIRESFRWVPDAFLWLYSYSYFNLLNLDNVVTSYPSPVFDGTSLSQLLPSFLRPGEVDDLELLEVSALTVSSYASALYRDFGVPGVALVAGAFAALARRSLHRLRSPEPFVAVASYSVLYFCFAFSFFVNFWFYLPVIFQLVFFWLFAKVVLKRHRPKHSQSRIPEALPC